MSKKLFYIGKALCASLVILLFTTPSALAWGSITHAHIMADVAEMLDAPAEMEQFMRNSAGGSVAVDWCCFIALYEKFVNQDEGSHNAWMVRHGMQHEDNFTKTMYDNADLPVEKAFAYGWMTHWPSSDKVENEYKAIKKEQNAPSADYLEVWVDFLTYPAPKKANLFIVQPELIIDTWEEVYPNSEYTPTQKDIQRGVSYARVYMWIIPNIDNTAKSLNMTLNENISLYYGDYVEYYTKSVDYAYDNVTNPRAIKTKTVSYVPSIPNMPEGYRKAERDDEATRAIYETIEGLIDSKAVVVPYGYQRFFGTLYVRPMKINDEEAVNEALKELTYELNDIFK